MVRQIRTTVAFSDVSDRYEDTPEQAAFRASARAFLADHAEPVAEIDPWQVSGSPMTMMHGPTSSPAGPGSAPWPTRVGQP